MVYNFGLAIQEELLKREEKGNAMGYEKGKSDVLIKLMDIKFQHVPDEYKEMISKFSSEQIDDLAMNIFNINDLSDLKKYLS